MDMAQNVTSIESIEVTVRLHYKDAGMRSYTERWSYDESFTDRNHLTCARVALSVGMKALGFVEDAGDE